MGSVNGGEGGEADFGREEARLDRLPMLCQLGVGVNL